MSYRELADPERTARYQRELRAALDAKAHEIARVMVERRAATLRQLGHNGLPQYGSVAELVMEYERLEALVDPRHRVPTSDDEEFAEDAPPIECPMCGHAIAIDPRDFTIME